MRLAFQAILKGDYAERDRQCDLAKQALEDERRTYLATLLEIDFFVTSTGVVIPATKMMAKA